jgi:plastocyanin
MSSSGTTVVGLIVSILIVGAVVSIGYFQFVVAPGLNITSTSSTSAAVNCSTSHTCVNVTIVSGAATPYQGYPGTTMQYGYQPLTLTVVIGVNNTVIWTDADTAFHTATSSSGPASFNSKCLDGVGTPCVAGTGSSTNSFQFTFTVAGTYHYSCSYHAWMQGTIIVKSA